MEYFINGHLQLLPGTSKEEIEALYMAERLKRKVHKKGPAPKLLGNERCEICGQLANGFHYNVLSCEGCKGFFRRTIINGIEYTCKTGNNECNLQIAIARQRCQKCRIIKCLKAGMNPNFVRKRKDDSICGPYERANPKCPRPSVIVNKMPKDQEKMLNDLAITWRTLCSAPLEWTDIRESNNVLEYIACIKGRLIQNFVTKLPDFNMLPTALRTDIISRAGNELTVLFLSTFFHKEYQVVKLEETEIDPDVLCYEFQMDETIVNRIFYYLNRQSLLLDKIYDQTILAIVAAMLLFAPDRGYNYAHYNAVAGYEDYLEIMTDFQSRYTNLLRSYVERYRSFQKSLFTDILMMLPTLREVNHEMQRYSSRQLMLLIQRSLAIPKQEFEPSEESHVSFPEIQEIKTELLDAV
jgi:hypothetical protein